MSEMIERPPEILPREDGTTIAYRQIDGKAPRIVFLGGLMSDMQGTKAINLENYCRAAGCGFTRLDYSGHGESSGEFRDGTISDWLADVLAVIDQCTDGPLVLVGSSMGGWIMLLTALARPDRVVGLIGIAAAPDFTRDLMWGKFNEEVKNTLIRDGVYYAPSESGDEPYIITMKLIEDGRDHLLLDKSIPLNCSVRLLHGMRDESVPWMTSARLAEKISSEDVKIFLVKDGDHRLSRDQDIVYLTSILEELLDGV
ncbi:MAG: hypothetical protein CFH41_01404 [Alphaproteobacteria bacterium MarineAlpha11_Bin1]|nr:MAG: hypothetical protein CFH41_01404 [Alphaproteobacteria bacterium MarineAlpha11_Bin1]|tara:strand:+ start:1059 stop:1826 length:768 start_codon:yes stop_codon:yes gene_type:complete